MPQLPKNSVLFWPTLSDTHLGNGCLILHPFQTTLKTTMPTVFLVSCTDFDGEKRTCGKNLTHGKISGGFKKCFIQQDIIRYSVFHIQTILQHKLHSCIIDITCRSDKCNKHEL